MKQSKCIVWYDPSVTTEVIQSDAVSDPDMIIGVKELQTHVTPAVFNLSQV